MVVPSGETLAWWQSLKPEAQGLNELARVRIDNGQGAVPHPADVGKGAAVEGDDVRLCAGGQREPVQQLTTRELQDGDRAVTLVSYP